MIAWSQLHNLHFNWVIVQTPIKQIVTIVQNRLIFRSTFKPCPYFFDKTETHIIIWVKTNYRHVSLSRVFQVQTRNRKQPKPKTLLNSSLKCVTRLDIDHAKTQLEIVFFRGKAFALGQYAPMQGGCVPFDKKWIYYMTNAVYIFAFLT